MKSVCVSQIGRSPINRNDRSRHGKGGTVQMLEQNQDEKKTRCLSTVQKDNMVLEYEEIGKSCTEY